VGLATPCGAHKGCAQQSAGAAAGAMLSSRPPNHAFWECQSTTPGEVQLDIRKKISERVVMHWHRLSWEMGELPSLEVLRTVEIWH